MQKIYTYPFFRCESKFSQILSGNSVQADNISTFYYRYLRYFLAKDDATATSYDKYMALSYAVRNQMVDKWIETQKRYHVSNSRRVYYLSMEYVLGKSLRQNVVNLGMDESVTQVARDLGFSLDEVYAEEHDCELGNGGKGRLAACYQESMATLGLPAMGYGLHYDYGLFQQEIEDGVQIERPFDWLHKGHPWETLRPEYACIVGFNGRLAPSSSSQRGPRSVWEEYDEVVAMPYDFPVPGYNTNTVNTIRLWSARPTEEFLSDYLNHGDYVRACEETSESGRITKVLFPDEDVRRTTEMRIKQQYFLVSASLQDIVRRFKQHNNDILELDKKVAIHLNGSRCAVAVPELLRILIDREGVPWQKAWDITRNVFSYTSHAVAKDNLENWPVYLMEQILPRHVQLVYEINQVHLDAVRKEGAKESGLIRELSLVEEGEVKRFKMAHLAVLGSHAVNGVSRMQTDLLTQRIIGPLALRGSASFINATNGIAHRRWLLCANRPLASLITEAIGDSWATNPEELERLAEFVRDDEFLFRLGDAKHAAKRRLANEVLRRLDIELDMRAMFDVQTKKIHPYKRQMLNLLGLLARYLRIKNGEDPVTSRLHIFAGKATPSDQLAKQIIKLIWIVSKIVNEDPQTAGKMSVVFVPDYGISWAEYLVPAADLSEQIATPHLEASATSNMKFAINGAVTIASKCGSNVEMIERIGSENVVAFGHGVGDIEALKEYKPYEVLESSAELKAVFSFLEKALSQFPDGHAVYPLLSSLQDADPFYVLLDFEDYVAKQRMVDEIYQDRLRWLAMALMNVANCGWFSSDRAVREYAAEIWNVEA
ncbi:MAG: glycogen/starch/alpha-glucan family phosphorylase [Chitinivibrionales bacterium]|nr:glycogen/starch/alpha-glucan family phosphorylase [Chitinivibrionales bacterium]MBD3396014.1 glycogen/starch/alpha-glucan family phosphorylase [Chitinivibrionales bacterium]